MIRAEKETVCWLVVDTTKMTFTVDLQIICYAFTKKNLGHGLV